MTVQSQFFAIKPVNEETAKHINTLLYMGDVYGIFASAIDGIGLGEKLVFRNDVEDLTFVKGHIIQNTKKWSIEEEKPNQLASSLLPLSKIEISNMQISLNHFRKVISKTVEAA